MIELLAVSEPGRPVLLKQVFHLSCPRPKGRRSFPPRYSQRVFSRSFRPEGSFFKVVHKLNSKCSKAYLSSTIGNEVVANPRYDHTATRRKY